MSKKKVTEATKAATEKKVDTKLEPVQLTLQDMTAVSNVIDLASRRGAFHASEMATVGNIFNKLTGFLNYVSSVQAKEAEAASEAAEQNTEVSAESE